MTQFYNLDAVISVGYRLNSIRATQFRQWLLVYYEIMPFEVMYSIENVWKMAHSLMKTISNIC